MERTKEEEEEHLKAALELGLRLGRGTPDVAELPPSDEWSSFVNNFPQSSAHAALSHLDKELASKSVLSGNGFTLSQTDFAVFATVRSSVIALPDPERQKFTNLLRWMSYIQSKVDVGESVGRIMTERPHFDFETPLRHLMSLQLLAKSAKPEADSRVKETLQVKKDAEKPKGDLNATKNDAKGKATGKHESSQDKKKQTEADKKKQTDAAVVEKDTELSVSLLNIQVGLIRKAWKHPSAESLLVEEIDVGDAKLRQVVSGLAKYCNPDELTNRRVVLITNVKPGKLRDVMSEGLVLCASNEDHSAVDPLLPPEGAKIGERISFSGIDGKPEDVLNPKKKQLEKITPNLFTDEKGVATFKGIPFMTSGGPITSSLPKATIK